MAKHVIVGTAGHIDHGKTALVKALTGIETDRWEEEKRRGITIDLGFAHLDCGPELKLGFVDVPGHERFVKNMLAGAGGIDLVLLVIAADESIMPQTREHFDICRLLGIERGIVVLTKSDLVDDELLELVKLEVQEYVESSFLARAPVIPVSSKTRDGLEELRETLQRTAAETRSRDSNRRFRMPVDRAFVMKGFGPVVTGTVTSGTVAVDSTVAIHPTGLRGRVRGLQGHGESSAKAGAGRRTAINFSGVEIADLRRGLELTEDGVFEPVSTLDCRLELLSSAKPLKNGAPIHFHRGAAEIEGRVFLLNRNPAGTARKRTLRPGESDFVRFRLERELVALPGDRFVVRQFSPVITIAGGRVLDNRPPRRESHQTRITRLQAFDSGDPARILSTLAAGTAEGVSADEIVRRTGWTAAEIGVATQSLERQDKLVVVRRKPLLAAAPWQIDAASERLTATLDAFHRKNPLAPGASREAIRSGGFENPSGAFAAFVIERLVRDEKLALEGDLIRLASHRVQLQQDEEEAEGKILAAFADAGLAVPGLKTFLPELNIDLVRARKILANLLRNGQLVRVTDDLVFHRRSMDVLLRQLAERKQQNPRISVPEFKELAGVSRKYAIPLLEFLDRQKITRRDSDARLIV